MGEIDAWLKLLINYIRFPGKLNMTLDNQAHRNVLIRILKDIYTDTSLGPILGFKGGTAVYLFYNLPRFSVDLDFDLIDKSKEEYVFEKIKAILIKYGTLKDSTNKRHNLFYLLSYSDKVAGAQNIKVEINRRDFGSRYEIKSYMGISMKIMIQQDIFANKLVAMHERLGKTNRDIFDVCFFLKNNWPINKDIVEKRTSMPFKDFIAVCVNALEKINNRNILSGIGELIDEKQKNWVKKNLKNETIFLLNLFKS